MVPALGLDDGLMIPAPWIFIRLNLVSMLVTQERPPTALRLMAAIA